MNNVNNNTIAVIYARFSSHNQRDESIEQQIAECKAYALQNNLDVTDIYSDSAQSGKSDKRTQYQKLLRDAKKGKFQCIIAYKSSRIARNMFNAMSFENEMEKYGVKVFYAKEEFGNNAAGRFALRTMMNVNQFFSENMGEDIKRNQADNALKCRANGPASYGYKRGEDGRFVVDENTAPIVQEIFTRVSNGEPFVDIQADLNERGVKTRTGKQWQKSSFSTIINNERYLGIYIFDNVRIEGGMPQIIDKELFYKVQDKLKNKKNPQGRHRENGDYILTGKLFCGHCGESMIGMSGTSKSGALHYYYICNGKRIKKNCEKKAVRRDYIETEIARGLREYLLNDETIEWIADIVEDYQRQHRNNPEILMLKKELEQISKSITNIMTAIEQGIITTTTKARLLDLEAEQANIKAKLALSDSKAFDVTREQVIAYHQLFREGNISDKEYQKKLFDAFLVAAYVYDNNVKLICAPFGDTNKSIDIVLEDLGVESFGEFVDCDCVRIEECTGHQTRVRRTQTQTIYSIGRLIVLNFGLNTESYL